MTGNRQREEMDAHHYWRQFPVTAHFLEPMEIDGTLIDLGQHHARDEIIPKLRIQTDDGTIVIVIAGQTRLQAELVKHAPVVGDRITITYTGEASKAAPGMNRTKEFTVVVKRPAATDASATDAVARTIAKAAGDLEARLGQLGADNAETIKQFRRSKGLTRPLISLSAEDRLAISAELDRRGWALPPGAAPPEPETASVPAAAAAEPTDLFGAEEPF